MVFAHAATESFVKHVQLLAPVGGAAGVLTTFFLSPHRGRELLEAITRGYALGTASGTVIAVAIWIGDVISR
jgi:hypothetical protein